MIRKRPAAAPAASRAPSETSGSDASGAGGDLDAATEDLHRWLAEDDEEEPVAEPGHGGGNESAAAAAAAAGSAGSVHSDASGSDRSWVAEEAEREEAEDQDGDSLPERSPRDVAEMLGGISTEVNPGTPLDRPGAPGTSTCTKNQRGCLALPWLGPSPTVSVLSLRLACGLVLRRPCRCQAFGLLIAVAFCVFLGGLGGPGRP